MKLHEGHWRSPTNIFDIRIQVKPMPRLRRVLLGLLGILIVLILWILTTGAFGLIKPLFLPYVLPSPEAVLIAAYDLIVSGELFIDAGWSLLRVLLGFTAAAIVAIPLGIAMGWSRTLSYIVEPIVEILRPIPPIAWIGLSLLWFGFGMGSAVFLVFIGAFFPILLNTVAGVRNVEKRLIEVAYTFGASDLNVLVKVAIPAALPTIYTGLRVGMGIGWMCVVAAEMVAVKYGLGNLIIEASNILRTDYVLVGMITIGLIGLAINYIFEVAGNYLFRWQKGINKEEA